MFYDVPRLVLALQHESQSASDFTQLGSALELTTKVNKSQICIYLYVTLY